MLGFNFGFNVGFVWNEDYDIIFIDGCVSNNVIENSFYFVFIVVVIVGYKIDFYSDMFLLISILLVFLDNNNNSNVIGKFIMGGVY